MHLSTLLPFTTLLAFALANPQVYGICQARCANEVMACYAASGTSFGAISTTADVIPEQMFCNADYSGCQVECIDSFIDWAKTEFDEKEDAKAADCLTVQE